MRFEVLKSKKTGQWYFHLRARNGRILCASELYRNKQNCLKTAKLVQRLASGAKILVFG